MAKQQGHSVAPSSTSIYVSRGTRPQSRRRPFSVVLLPRRMLLAVITAVGAVAAGVVVVGAGLWSSTAAASTTTTTTTTAAAAAMTIPRSSSSHSRTSKQQQQQQQYSNAPPAAAPPENHHHHKNRDNGGASSSSAAAPFIPTVFGEIVRGERPGVVRLAESDNLLAFQDHRPRARFHALIVPAQRPIGSVLELTSGDLPLLCEMKQMADAIYFADRNQTQGEGEGKKPSAQDEKKEEHQSPLLVFHIPPFHSVPHLHLHVLDGGSRDALGRLKYPATTRRYCTTWRAVVERLRNGQPPTPYGSTSGASSFCGAAGLWELFTSLW